MYLQSSSTGLGAAQVVTGPDGQPRVVMDTPITTVDVFANAPDVYRDSAGNVIPLASAGQWITGIPNIAVGAAGVGLLLILFGSMRR